MAIPSRAFCGVTRVNNVVVKLDDAPWPFATQNREKISAFWQVKQTSHPHFYNGQVHVMASWEIKDAATDTAVFVGNLHRTNFASFLYWIDSGGNARKEADFSGGAALLCTDGALLMAVSGAHSIVPGTLEFPSGFVDVADFEDNALNFDRHVAREVMEEFSITPAQLGEKKQYLVSAADGIVQVISTFSMDIDGSKFVQKWSSRTKPLQSEIADVVAIYRSSDLAGYSIQTHVKAALSYLLAPDYSPGSRRYKVHRICLAF
jgi:hypothetical protein